MRFTVAAGAGCPHRIGLRITLAALMALLPIACGSPRQLPIQISGNSLRTADGAPFRVWGFNYTNPGNLLLEDRWDTEAGWAAVAGDFREMKALGANTVRLHLQFNKFMVRSTQADPAALKNLQRLTAIAENQQLYLIVTGLGAYRKQDSPAWYDALGERERWAAQAAFWRNVAQAAGNSPALLAYDLMNEPVAAVNPAQGWLPGEPLGGFLFVQNLTLDLAGRDAPAVMRSWIQAMTAAVRQVDPRTPVTVGFLPFASQAQFAGDLDLVSVHIYPKSSAIRASDQLIQQFQTGKPLLVSETYPLDADVSELRAFIRANNPYVAGWLGHYFGNTIADLTPPRDMPAALEKAWLELFREMSAAQKRAS